MRISTLLALTLALTLAPLSQAQTDPGPRGGPPPAGGPPQGAPPPAGNALSGMPIQGLSGTELQIFDKGRDAFTEITDVAGGLGPRFNFDSCVGCHAAPAPGGSSPAVNPQVRLAAKF